MDAVIEAKLQELTQIMESMDERLKEVELKVRVLTQGDDY